MRPVTIRRLLVFGVCLVGVGCLYLLPSTAGSSSRPGAPPSRQDVPLSPPATVSLASATTPTPALTRGWGFDNDLQRLAIQPRVGATAAKPGRADNPPDAVSGLALLGADPDSLTIGWSAPADERDIVGYRVWLNGFLVLTTQQTRASLSWFNDSDTHVIQVRAVDSAGNEGPSTSTLLVRRPAPVIQPTATQSPHQS